MDANCRDADTATAAHDQKPFKHRHLGVRGRSNSPVVVVYDHRQKKMQVRNKKNVGQYSACFALWLVELR